MRIRASYTLTSEIAVAVTVAVVLVSVSAAVAEVAATHDTIRGYAETYPATNLSDTVVTATGTPVMVVRPVRGDTIILSDTAALSLGITSISDTVTASDVAVRSPRPTFADSVSPLDTKVFSIRPGPVDTVTLDDNFTRTAAFVRGMSDSVTPSDAPVLAVTFNRTASDSITSSDNLSAVMAFVRTLSDSLTASDSPAILVSIPASDTVMVTDANPVTSLVVGNMLNAHMLNQTILE